MDIAELEQLMQLVNNANVSELTLRHNGERLTIRKSVPGAGQAGSTALTLMPPDAVGMADFAMDMTLADGPVPEEKTVPVIAPFVGIFHHAKAPVVLAAHVKAGQVIGYIEVLNLSNDVKAPVAGKVVEVMAEEGQPVEYGQELYILQPDN